MALNQMRAVTNRRIKPNYVEGINAQTHYLPQLYQQKEDDAYKTKLYDQNERSMSLNEKSLAQSNEIAKRNEALGWAQLDEQKDQAKKARNLGYANIALGGATGLAGLYQSGKPLLDKALPELSGVSQDVLPDIGENIGEIWDIGSKGVSDAVSGVSDAVANTGEFWDFGGTSDFNVTDLVPDVVKNIGGAIWDAGSSFLDDIGGLFS